LGHKVLFRTPNPFREWDVITDADLVICHEDGEKQKLLTKCYEQAGIPVRNLTHSELDVGDPENHPEIFQGIFADAFPAAPDPDPDGDDDPNAESNPVKPDPDPDGDDDPNAESNPVKPDPSTVSSGDEKPDTGKPKKPAKTATSK